ncbi:hypothetical protein BMS3Abin17_00165 [archaeon BMS3Abin17]|nr:hypothetical protein BMS3Abin17_00165 [archaeon BMS3Abin17]
MNSQIHLTIDTVTLNRLQSEDVDIEISVKFVFSCNFLTTSRILNPAPSALCK